MSILNKFKQAFGFGSNEFEDEETYGVDATVQPLQRPKMYGSAGNENYVSSAASVDDQPAEVELPPVPVDSIFNTVVNEFNKAMPSFLASAANEEAQRRHLYEALEADVKKFLDDVDARAMERCNLKWENEKHTLDNDLATLRQRLKSLEENDAERKTQLLSAERQKRAMTERIHDLEMQIADLEAEKDQYQLETRTLANKLRVSNMINEGVEVPDIESYESRISQLQSQLDEASAQCQTLTADNESLKSENNDVKSQLESLKLKTEMTDVMLNDLNTRASAATKNAEAKDSELDDLRTKLKDALSSIDELQEELNEANSNLEIAASIQHDIENIQTTITQKNNQIAELKLELRRRDDRINALETEEASLRRTIESNLMNQANAEKELREEMSRMEQQLQSLGSKDKVRAKRKTAAKISAIDDDLDNTDWLVGTPPEGTVARTPGVSDDEFGYKEPQRKTPPENSAQMSLW